MIRTTIMLTLVVLSGFACAAATTDAALEAEKQLGVTFDLTYVSKWLSKGAEAYGSRGAFFETVDVDLYGSGFGVQVTHRSATASGYVNGSRIDYRPYYKNKLFADSKYVMNYNISVGYEHYYKLKPANANTTWEWNFAFSWPKIIGHGFTPKYVAFYEYPANGNRKFRNKVGWAHLFEMGYDMKVEQLPKPLYLSAGIVYNDGLGNVPSDWSYLTLGIGTSFNITENLSFHPSLFHQITLDRSICKHKDVTYCQLSMKYKF